LAAVVVGAVVIGLLKDLLVEQITVTEMTEDLRGQDRDLSPDDAEALAEVLVPFIRSMPDALAWAMEMSKDRRCGRAVAFGTGSVLHYVFDEEDLLPEATFGAVGLIDDAFLVHAFVRHLNEAFPFAAPGVAYEPPTLSAIQLVTALLPEGVAAALLRTCKGVIQVAAALFTAPVEIDAHDRVVAPSLRTRAAAQAVHADRQPTTMADDAPAYGSRHIFATTAAESDAIAPTRLLQSGDDLNQ
jgi:hypothetical protein